MFGGDGRDAMIGGDDSAGDDQGGVQAVKAR
jgi:hypothetical protein